MQHRLNFLSSTVQQIYKLQVSFPSKANSKQPKRKKVREQKSALRLTILIYSATQTLKIKEAFRFSSKNAKILRARNVLLIRLSCNTWLSKDRKFGYLTMKNHLDQIK